MKNKRPHPDSGRSGENECTLTGELSNLGPRVKALSFIQSYCVSVKLWGWSLQVMCRRFFSNFAWSKGRDVIKLCPLTCLSSYLLRRGSVNGVFRCVVNGKLPKIPSISLLCDPTDFWRKLAISWPITGTFKHTSLPWFVKLICGSFWGLKDAEGLLWMLGHTARTCYAIALMVPGRSQGTFLSSHVPFRVEISWSISRYGCAMCHSILTRNYPWLIMFYRYIYVKR